MKFRMTAPGSAYGHVSRETRCWLRLIAIRSFGLGVNDQPKAP